MNSDIPLGKSTEYPEHYDASLLFPVPRSEKRREIGIEQQLPFCGRDIWTAYELSWLNSKGKPQVAIAEFEFPCESPQLIESKSFKLYLNSYNQERLSCRDELMSRLEQDLSDAAGAKVAVRIYSLDDYQQKGFGKLQGDCIDELDIDCEHYDYRPQLLSLAPSAETRSETLYSHLLKSNCLITSQPDWATLIVEYKGTAICRQGLLAYLVSFRNHNEFHEQCVERIFQDIMRYCSPEELTVIARYTRRGGLDINPWRSNLNQAPDFLRLARP